ncbi:protein kinase domain-containing protein [Glaciibacter sp. 2TAF33]|uniref:protein kinase domain-containing protein n=1 Tax=Glaciibacter sp. 2TAF33 TaxID=3233015 RepID=UPI003F93C0A6
MPEHDEAAGRLLGGRYALETPVGYGGMSTVYRARDELLGRPVAVKFFHPGATDVARQESELAVLAALDHHSLVQLFDAGVDMDGRGRRTRYLVMAFVNGPTLRQRLRHGPLAARHIGEIGYDMAEALEYIHSHNVVHRDIKPSNIMLVDYGNDVQRARAKLTDFGIALADDVERMTAQGMTTGTAAYLSPEQASGQDVGPASDVYALGLVLLECFTRDIEFPGSLVESALARLSRDPVIPGWLPEHWRRLLTAMTARNPADRPVKGELVATLRQVVIASSARHKEPTEPLFISTGDVRPPLPKPDILDDIPNQALQRATALAARLFSAPIAVVSVVDHDRLWLKSYYGDEIEEIARQVDVTASITPLDEAIVIEDGRVDPRAKHSPLVTGPLGIRFYVGVPLRTSDERTIGTLSVLGIVPGTASGADIANLEDIAALVVAQLEMRHEGIRNTAS